MRHLIAIGLLAGMGYALWFFKPKEIVEKIKEIPKIKEVIKEIPKIVKVPVETICPEIDKKLLDSKDGQIRTQGDLIRKQQRQINDYASEIKKLKDEIIKWKSSDAIHDVGRSDYNYNYTKQKYDDEESYYDFPETPEEEKPARKKSWFRF